MNKLDINKLENHLIKVDKRINLNRTQANKDFEKVLNKIENNSNKIKFSKHASKRLDSRNIDMTKGEIGRLEDAFTKAEKSGVKNALIMIDNKAFIANIKSKTVVTTFEKESLKENVFTNIDGAVII